MTDSQNYIRWLRAAYFYYIQPGEDTGMTDAEWDHWSRYFFAHRANMPKHLFPVLHHPDFQGGSLYWLKSSEYPAEAKQPV